MQIKQFSTHKVRVADPLHPGKRTFEDRLIASGGGSISFPNPDWKADPKKSVEENDDDPERLLSFTADEDGWLEVPDFVGEHLTTFTHHTQRTGTTSRFYTPEEVDEYRRIGTIEEQEAAPAPKRARSHAAAVPKGDLGGN